jgi:hypothetical protein
MNRVLTLRSLKFSEQREEENQSKVTPNFALLNEKNIKNTKNSHKKSNNNNNNTNTTTTTNNNNNNNGKNDDIEEKTKKNENNNTNTNPSTNVLFGTQKSSLIAITHETISTTASTNTQQTTPPISNSKKTGTAKRTGEKKKSDGERKEKNTFSAASATSNAMNRFSAPILVDDSLVQRRVSRDGVEERGIFCSLGHAYVCQGDVELGVPGKDVMKSFMFGDEKQLLDTHVPVNADEMLEETNQKTSGEKSNEDASNTEATTPVKKVKPVSKALSFKPVEASPKYSTETESEMDNIQYNSAQIRLETITRWRNEFDATKQKKDRELIKKLVSRDEARKFVLSSQETMEKSIQKLLFRPDPKGKKTISSS